MMDKEKDLEILNALYLGTHLNNEELSRAENLVFALKIDLENRDKEKETKMGVCECCGEENNNQIDKLYKVGKYWRCGDCANQHEGDKKFDLMAYGED